MKILIIYGTTEGQTRKIAGFLKEEAEKSGNSVTLADASNNPPDPAGYDVTLIGASLHMQKYQGSVVHYIKQHAEALNKMKSGFFSVSLAVAADDVESWEELRDITSKFIKETGWNNAIIEQVAGALLYTKYDFFKKLIMRLIAKSHGESTDTSVDHEYTNWTDVKSFLGRVLRS